MNKLQGQAFKINSDWLKYIQEHENLLVENGLLMPRFLAELCEKDVLNILRDFYIKDNAIKKKVCSLAEFFYTLCSNIQRSRE